LIVDPPGHVLQAPDQGPDSLKERRESLHSASLDIYALSRHAVLKPAISKGISHDCSREFLTLQCLKCGHRHSILSGSRDRTCPACANELYHRIYDHYKELIADVPNLKFLTLTWKPVEFQDARIVRAMGEALNKLLHRKRYARLWKGLLATVECKKTPSGKFYYHIHCLLSGAYVPQALISKDWREISGFPIVHVKRISRTPRRALRYVLKYILKGFSFAKSKDKIDFKMSMRGVRYVRSYGDFYNFQYKHGTHVYFPCPNCEAVKSWVVLEFCDLVDLVEGVPYKYGDYG